MAVDIGKMMEKSPEGYLSMSWILYIASAGICALTLGEISGTLLFFGAIVIIVLASSRAKDAGGTIYQSHLDNIKSTMMVNLIAALVLIALTWITFGIAIFITWPLFLILLCWTGFKLIRGMMKLNDGVDY